jgi:hypothetical protein
MLKIDHQDHNQNEKNVSFDRIKKYFLKLNRNATLALLELL